MEKVKDATDAKASSDKYLFDTNISYYIEKVGWVWGESKLEDREGQGDSQQINIDSIPCHIDWGWEGGYGEGTNKKMSKVKVVVNR